MHLKPGAWLAALCLLTHALWPAVALPADPEPRSVPQLNLSPPRIAVAYRPTRLMLVDGPPARVKIRGTQLEFVVNTDWSVFFSRETQAWYLLDEGFWLTNSTFSSGDWIPATELPRDFLTLQVSSNWPRVAASLPPAARGTPPAPFLISYEPTELVVIDGEPLLEDLADTGLQFVSNTRHDLFLLGKQYYLLVSGRWFTTKNLGKKWYAVRELPAVFREIPAAHEKARVLASVPGTPAADKAREEASRPRIARIARDAGSELEVPYVGEPSFVPIEGTVLSRAENTPFQVIRHNNFHYLCHEGAWYSSTDPRGPWQAALQVPEAIYDIPPTDPAFNVTYVRLGSFDDSSGEVAYVSTGGYYSRYWTGSSVVYGTGWHYPGYYRNSVYWRYPHTYGYPRAYWDPWWPHGYHYSATFTVKPGEKDWEWDLDGNKRRVYDYGPRNYVGSGEYNMYDSKPYRSDTENR
ncbi:MAG: hypothetical protein KJO33_10880 [Gammaproteobacteria bacterium]|nr:hypothetical protein [Gammaproteobacteria bacterium]